MARFRFARGKVAQSYVRHCPGARRCRGDKPDTKRTRVIVRTRLNEGRYGPFRRASQTEGSEGKDADDQPVDCQATAPAQGPQYSAGPAGLSAKARSLHARLYDDAEEAELGIAQGGEGAPHQRV